MAAPTIATTGATNDSFSGTLTLAPPASIADGDLLEAIFFVYQNSANSPTLAGWTKKVDVEDGPDFIRTVTLYKRASSESGSYAFTLTSPVYWAGFVRRITGAIASGDPYDVVGTSAKASSASPSASATTTTADTLVTWYVSNFSSGTTVSSPPSGISGTQASSLYAGSKSQAVAGSTGALTGTLSASDNWVAVVAAIKPPSGGATTTKSADDSLTPSDQALRSIKRGRVASEQLTISDSTVQFYRRLRLLSDAAGITDGLAYWRRMQRVATDSADVVDGFIKALLRSGGINVVVASDSVEVSDSAVEVFRKIRLMFDFVEADDGIVRVLWSKKYLSDALGVSESMIATLVPYVTFQYAPRIVLGKSDYLRAVLGKSEHCEIVLGGYSL